MRKGALDLNGKQTNKMEEIKEYIKKKKLHYMILIETNIHGKKYQKIANQKYTKKEAEDAMTIEGFTIELSDAWEKYEVSRIVMYCDKNRLYKRLKPNNNENDLQNVTIEIGKSKKFILTACYREHTGGASGMSNLESQKERFTRQLKLWKGLQRRNEDTLIIGDANIDFRRLNDPNYKLTQLAEMLQDWMIEMT